MSNKKNLLQSDDGGNAVALLSDTSKMPCWSWGITPGFGFSCPRAFGNLCKLHCYAKVRQYAMGPVPRVHRIRFAWFRECLKSESGREEFVRRMTTAIAWSCASRGSSVFRAYDSGDFHSPKAISYWYDVAAALPQIRFWFPTRTWNRNGEFAGDNDAFVVELRKLHSLDNVTVRPSALNTEDAAPAIAGLGKGSAVTKDASKVTCNALRQDGECRDCRKCWNSEFEVTYKLH